MTIAGHLTQWFAVQIESKVLEAEGIWKFELVSHDSSLPPFEAGAHIDVLLADKIRQYSLCNSPSDHARYVIAVQREDSGRGGSRHFCDDLIPGDRLQVRGPKNFFRIGNSAGNAVLLAGGIGITPIVAIAEELHARSAAFELHAFARNERRAAFRSYLKKTPFAASVHWHFDDARESEKKPLHEVIGKQAQNRQIYVCGPGGFISAATHAAKSLGWHPEAVHVERFSAEPAAPGIDTPFVMQIKSTGQLVEVASDKTAADALEEIGIEVLRSCNEGLCGTCITRVVAGQPDHRDQILTDEERAKNECFTPCCSRALSEILVLDL